MNNLQTHAVTKDVTVNQATGEAYISQRKVAEKLGIDQSSVSRWCASMNYDVKQGLSSEIFSLCINHYALDSRVTTREAKQLLKMISQAGAKAYLYHEAGIAMSASTQMPRPLTYIESLELLLASEKEKEALRIENLKTTVALTDKRNITNEGEDYFTIAAVKPLNQGMKLSGLLLSRESDDQEIPPIKQYAPYSGLTVPSAYHREVWEAVYPEIILPY